MYLCLLSELRRLALDRRLDPESVALSPDGARPASVPYGAGAVLYDASTGALLAQAPGDIGSGVSVSPDGRWLAMGETDQGGGALTLLEIGPFPEPWTVG